MKTIAIALGLLLVASSSNDYDASLSRIDRLVVWNVGQGLWTTWVLGDECRHFDMGGERAPWQAISKLCSHRRNSVRFSHWDQDHIGFVRRARNLLANLCLAARPRGNATAKKMKLLEAMSECDDPIGDLNEISPSPLSDANSSSRVYVAAGRWLLPGDSPSSQERIWLTKLSGSSPGILVLGHHGSRSSTSKALLDHLVKLKLAVASARRKRYGHPHRHVLAHLKQYGVAAISTEDWGTLHWEAPPRGLTVDKRDIPYSSCEPPAHSKHSHCKRSGL